MASPPRVAENPETASYYATQAALGASLVASIRNLAVWLNPTDLPGTYPNVRTGAAALAGQSALAAVSLAADYYDDFRESVDAPGKFTAPVIDAPTSTELAAQLDEATAPLFDSLDSLVDELYLAEVTAQIQAEVEGAMQAATADAGIGELFAAMRADGAAKGWARITRPTACSFCRMLAARGPVYLTEESANFRAHVVKDGRGGTCQCTAEPWIGPSYEPTALVRADVKLWDQITDEGFKGADARNEFRRRVEGRADGPRRQRGKKGKPLTPAKVQAQRLGFDFLTPSQLSHQLDVLEKLPDSAYRTKQVARVRARLAVLGA